MTDSICPVCGGYRSANKVIGYAGPLCACMWRSPAPFPAIAEPWYERDEMEKTVNGLVLEIAYLKKELDHLKQQLVEEQFKLKEKGNG